MAPEGPAYHVDWIFSNTSNVHVANHRDWFTTFAEFKTHLVGGLGTEGNIQVLGIGTVELDVKTHLNRKGSKARRKITLREVLFVPSSVCNILGTPIFEDFNAITQGGMSGGLKDKQTGGSAGLFDCPRLFKLWLVGHTKGRTSLTSNNLYWIYVTWPDEQRARWFLYQKVANAERVSDESKPEQQSQVSPTEYTAAEK